MQKGTTVEAQERIDAPPEVIYDLVADVTRMGDWSPECVSCEWIDGATGPTVGARFRGRNRHGLARWSNKPRVVAAERGREFGFVALDPIGRDMTKWLYRMEPTVTGTTLTESFEMVRTMPLYIRLYDRWVMGVKDRRADPEANMRTTLSNVRTAVEKAEVGHT
jgi:Polyketide cyclase / dehydrase and lipid transport